MGPGSQKSADFALGRNFAYTYSLIRLHESSADPRFPFWSPQRVLVTGWG